MSEINSKLRLIPRSVYKIVEPRYPGGNKRVVSMTVGLNIQIEEDQGITLVRVEGRLDAASAPLLEKKLVEQVEGGKTKLLLDFAKVNYLSSAGMRLLLSTTKKLKGVSGGLHLCSVSEEVMEIIKMAGFERIILIFPTEQEALQAFSN